MGNPLKRPLRGASWAAVSSLPQAKKVSLEDQLAANREHAARHGVEIVAELVVPGDSRDIALYDEAERKMTAYVQLRDLVERKAIDVLFFLDRSRLGRQASLSMSVVALCASHGVAIYDVESPPPSIAAAAHQTHDDMLIGAIKSVGAEREIRKLQERHKNGMIGRIKQGHMANKIVYGYKALYDEAGTKRIEIDEPAAAVVRRIVALYLDGYGTRKIGELLTAERIPAPAGGQWRQINVKNILGSVRRYAGYSEINKQSRRGRPYVSARGNWQPIIDDATAERVEVEREYRAASRRRVGTSYHLTGIVVCKTCGKRLNVQRGKPRKPHYAGPWQLVCLHHANIGYRRVMAYLHSKMESLNGADLDSLSADAPDPSEAIRAHIAGLAERLGGLDVALERADNAYVRGAMTQERYDRQVQAIERDADDLRAQIAQQEAALKAAAESGGRRQRLEEAAALGLAKLEDPDVTAANAWLRLHVRIWIDGNKIYAVEWL